MGRSVQVESLAKKALIVEYLQTGIVPKSKQITKISSFKKSLESYHLIQDILFFKKNDTLLEILCLEDKEKINEVLTRLHLPGHNGNFDYFLFIRYEKIMAIFFQSVLWNSSHCS